MRATPFSPWAQTRRRRQTEEAVRRLAPAGDAWAEHDGHEPAGIMADEADVVTLQTTMRFLRPDLAVVHRSSRIEGDRNRDGTLRPQRYAMMAMVAGKRNGASPVMVARNTNAVPGIDRARARGS